MTQRSTAFDTLVRDFRWSVPSRLNIAVDVVDRWAGIDPRRPAVLTRRDGGGRDVATYGDLAEASARLANALAGLGVARGDRVAILLPQSVEAVVAHLAVYRMAAVALPLAILFGADALEYRLRRAGARAVVTTVAGAERIAALRDRLPELSVVVATDGPAPGAADWTRLLEAAAPRFSGVDTGPRDPALMIFTSGTTGLPKPALHGHSVLAGHMPGIDLSQDGLGRPGDVMWTPADWAWAGGLLNALLPALRRGVPVVAHRFEKFDPERALALMAEFAVTNAFLPPTALKIMRGVGPVRGRFALALRAVGSAGEALGREAYHWAEEAFGFPVNEFYGQTECNAVIGSAHALGVGKPGAIGRPIPGHRVAVIGPDGRVLPPGEPGQIAIRRPDPVMFLGYAGDPEATAAKFLGDWMTTGDAGVVDEDGYVAFVGRDDDVITSAGYRIGPGEIEDCLLSHPAVDLAVAVGKPDPVRTEIVKAFVRLKAGVPRDEATAASIRAHVRERLSAHEYPREVAFVDDIPMTTSGKLIRRGFRDLARAEAAGEPVP
ncbi:AMP-binding protein [Oharaeibacter diazotrophicus]|uniref:Acetyl-CoA synthetase n=3 Tax=Oharaeibacter diazotrophicus TaxID=1920512 RepID=A0A4V3CVX3_9HYPH|nr:AMP-binding protein [Oharaeibacter diazotrophicus]TDP84128.1 acetyl-CoA synthetase [Oharaeibacter diazotrophicus]BBE73167.1 acetyl-coenzyme A synthetase [Pleomorphomonas sp. SM30]GLS74956.1 AMP-dependent synthetase [Oharaeibacter diazotrophicus]